MRSGRWLAFITMAFLLPGCQGGGCFGPAVPGISTIGADHLVLVGRQKFIGLTAYIPGVAYDDIAFTIVQQPASGVLVGSPPNVCYVPHVGFQGVDSFLFDAAGGGQTIRKTVTLRVVEKYIPPIGIPAPDFGIEQSHTMYSGALFDFGAGPEPYRDGGNGPYTHYVDFGIGSDAGNPFGTQTSPRRTIPTDLPAGSVVEIHGSGYDDRPRYYIRGAGTKEKPIFLRGANALSKPVIRRTFTLECSFIIVEYIDFDCRDFVTGVAGPIFINVVEQPLPTLQTFDNVAIRHCLFRDQPTTLSANPTAINFSVDNNANSPNNDTDLMEHLVVYDVEIRNFSTWSDFSGTLDYSGVSFGANTRHGWVLDSHIHHLRGDGVGISRTNALSDQAPAQAIHIGRNYLHHFKENCVDVKLTADCILSQNVMHTVRASDSSSGDAVEIQNADATAKYPASDNVWVIFNEICDAERGVHHASSGDPVTPDVSRSYIVSNVFHDIRVIRGSPTSVGAAIHKGQLAQSRIIGNTIYNCGHGIWLGLPLLTEPEKSSAVVRNNVIADLIDATIGSPGTAGMHLLLVPHATIPHTQIGHNLHWENAGPLRLNIAGPGNADGSLFSVDELRAGSQFGIGSIQADPGFADASLRDFHLNAGSPCIGAGVMDEVYAVFAARYGLSIESYQDGTPLAPGRFDIGALPPR